MLGLMQMHQDVLFSRIFGIKSKTNPALYIHKLVDGLLFTDGRIFLASVKMIISSLLFFFN